MDRNTLVAVGKNLERAKGCIVDNRILSATIAAQLEKIELLEAALNYVDTATAALEQVEYVRQSLDLRQKIRQWFRDRWKDLTAFILGIIAATEAAYIIYQTVQI